jgi:hypothetical protein
MKKWLVGVGLLFLVLFQPSILADETAVLTVRVADVYGDLIDDARVYIDYVYPQDEDVEIPYQFTKNGVTTFYLEAEREYTMRVYKAGFTTYMGTVELEDDTTVDVMLEYAQNVPLLHMKRYTVTPQKVGPGEYFQVYVVIENEGTGDALSVKVTFDPVEDVSPVQPSSSAYFERLDVSDITSVSQSFVVSGEALSGVYDLSLTITYSDNTGASYSAQETVGISILRKPMVKLLNVDYPVQAEQGESFTFSVDIANTGRFDVNGLYLEVESDMDWEYTSYYIGSLEAGDFDSYESEVVPSSPGECTFVIRVGFVDDFNRELSQEESYSVYVIEKVQETPLPQEERGLWQRFIDFLKSFLGLD